MKPLNYGWMFFGLLLNKIVSPIILGMIYFIMIAPIAVFRRSIGSDELKIKNKNQNKKSYWIIRKNKMFSKESFKNQF